MITGSLSFRLCPRCGRAVAADTQERFCINDGAPLLERCAHCRAEIHSPYAQFCAQCGKPYEETPRGQPDGEVGAVPARPVTSSPAFSRGET